MSRLPYAIDIESKYLDRYFLPSPLMGEGEGGGEARARPACRGPSLPPSPLSQPFLATVWAERASVTAPLPPLGEKERKACTRTYVRVLRFAFTYANAEAL
jgi:hypothetical protein